MSGGKKRKQGGGGGGGGSSNGFKALGLSDEVYNGIVRMGFRMPTPVQRKALPVVLSGVDTVVMARTGSGKTCAFLIPLLEKLLATPKGTNGNHVRGIILSPTRELSMQTLKVFNKLTSGIDIRAIGIHGGEGMEKQFHLLSTKPDVIVATPGRLAHHISEIPDFHLSGCYMCILDEADRLVEMGFVMQIRQIAKSLPESCQKVLLSATMPKMLIEFTKSGFSVDPAVVRLDNEATVSEELRIAFITCRSTDKDAALLHVMQHIDEDKRNSNSNKGGNNIGTGLTLIFAATRHHVEYITTLLLASGFATTMIYGTLDQEARKQNLYEFRTGKKPVLVVTDVAARGIDVPLIDHVIHYHFPPSPKLFVHRSGRAARAGRIGYCWAFVEPEEMPYMIDLHLFLGRRPTTLANETYTLKEMTPDMVHYGSLPESVATIEVENVQRIMNSELSGSIEAESLRALTRVCTNAMKQYRRTRSEASKEGVRRAKAILEGERTDTGQRLDTGAIPPHPLLKGAELRNHAKYRGSDNITNSDLIDNLQKREDFLRAMSNFRPKETVFEAFATGKNKDISVVSQIDKGRTSTNKNKNDSSVALTAMKNMRRQMRMVRDKGSTLVVAGSTNALELNGEAQEIIDDIEQEQNTTNTKNISTSVLAKDITTAENESNDENDKSVGKSTLSAQVLIEGKGRLSKAERRRLKKSSQTTVTDPGSSLFEPKKKKVKHASDFRDPVYFIDNDFTSNVEESDRSRRVEAAMQPSSSSAARGSTGAALRIEEAMFDIVGDENDELVKKQRMMRWDKSKRKYVQTTVGNELSGESRSKKLRLESGQLVKSDKLKLGELYQKWQKKTNRSIGRTGVFDDFGNTSNTGPVGKKKDSSKNKKGNKGSNKHQKDEMKSSKDIRREREKKHNLKIKNMKKSDRRILEQKQRNNNEKSGRDKNNRQVNSNKR